MLAFANSMEMLPHIKTVLKEFDCRLLSEIEQEMDGLEDLYHLIKDAICDDPPVMIREGGMIRTGFDKDIDMLRTAKTEGKTLPSWKRKTESEPALRI